MTRGIRLIVNVCSTSGWNSSFSSIVATGSNPPYGVRFFPEKSKGVEAPILLGFECTLFFVLCLFGAAFGVILFSVHNHLGDLLGLKECFAKLSFTPVFRGSQMVLSFFSHSIAPIVCIIQVSTSLDFRMGFYYRIDPSNGLMGYSIHPSLKSTAHYGLLTRECTRRLLKCG
jgi:hypothetical protein